MTEDEAVCKLKRQLGVTDPTPPELLIAVRLNPLLNLISETYRALGYVEAIGRSAGDKGMYIVNDVDRSRRTINYLLSELTSKV